MKGTHSELLMSLPTGKSIKLLTEAFLSGLKSVNPSKIVSDNVYKRGNKLIIKEHEYPLQNTYSVGFGKAVYSMATSLEKSLNSDGSNLLKKFILSIPKGSKVSEDHEDEELWEIYEGAANNLPDEAAVRASKRIVNFVSSLTEKDFLIVLISGGGSALLPCPTEPMTLQEKRKLIKDLSISGASIEEMNSVRRAISSVKGGRLGEKIKCQTVTLMISDVIGDNFETIASGPTVPNKTSIHKVQEVLNKYRIEQSPNLKQVLEHYVAFPPPLELSHIHNYQIGTNSICLQGIYKFICDAEILTPIIVTSKLNGEAAIIGKKLARISLLMLESFQKKEYNKHLERMLEDMEVEPGVREILEESINSGRKAGICLVFGGETTVVVKGMGKGGRNQELVLSAGIEIEEISKNMQPQGSVVILSGGTDGIDGPTDAAGGITWYSGTDGKHCTYSIGEGRKEGIDPEHYLENNDSYNYFDKVSQGIYHLKTGHTGTNVMDVQLVCIQPL